MPDVVVATRDLPNWLAVRALDLGPYLKALPQDLPKAYGYQPPYGPRVREGAPAGRWAEVGGGPGGHPARHRDVEISPRLNLPGRTRID